LDLVFKVKPRIQDQVKFQEKRLEELMKILRFISRLIGNSTGELPEIGIFRVRFLGFSILFLVTLKPLLTLTMIGIKSLSHLISTHGGGSFPPELIHQMVVCLSALFEESTPKELA